MPRGARPARDLAREIRGGNPVRASLLLLLILAFLAIAGVWAARTELDVVTRGDGRVVPSGDVQIVQASEAGVLAALHVREGDLVAAGDPLLTLDDTQIESQLGETRRRALSLELRIARLRAEIESRPFAPDAATYDELGNLVASEIALYAARRAALADEIAVLRRQGRQREEEIAAAAARAEAAAEAIRLIDEEIALIAPLVEDGVEPATTLLGLRGRRAEAAGRESAARAELAATRAAAAEIEDRVLSARSAARAGALEDLARAEAELAEVLTRLPALENRLTRAVLTAPVRGVVNRLNLNTIGGLARAGDPLLEIVPIGDDLLIEAYLKPADIAFLRPGQAARVSITAYDPSRYGALDGEILRIGADAVTRPDRDERAFVVEIATAGVLRDADGQPVEILPGMVAGVDILAGRRTVLAYLMAPVVRTRDRALRE